MMELLDDFAVFKNGTPASVRSDGGSTTDLLRHVQEVHHGTCDFLLSGAMELCHAASLNRVILSVNSVAG